MDERTVGLDVPTRAAIVPAYENYVSYEPYIMPGPIVMVQLFNGMQNSPSMVYDREMGSMKTLLVSPLQRWHLLLCKLLAGTFVSLLQAYAFLLVAGLFGIHFHLAGLLLILPVLIVPGLMLATIGSCVSRSAPSTR